MKEEYKDIVIELGNGIRKYVLEFMDNKFFYGEELKKEFEESNMHDVMKIILSSHMTSLANCMMAICDNNNTAEKATILFLNKLFGFLNKMSDGDLEFINYN